MGVNSFYHEALHRTCQKADGTDDVSKVRLLGQLHLFLGMESLHAFE